MCQSFPPVVVDSKYLSFLLVTLKPRMADTEDHKPQADLLTANPEEAA